MRIKRKISERISAGFDGKRFFIARKNNLPGEKPEKSLIVMNTAEAWRLKCWLGDARSIWAIENMGKEEAAPLLNLLNVTVAPETLDSDVKGKKKVPADHDG